GDRGRGAGLPVPLPRSPGARRLPAHVHAGAARRAVRGDRVLRDGVGDRGRAAVRRKGRARMFMIRKKQREALADRGRAGIERRRREALVEMRPAACEALGEDAVAAFVHEAVRRAASYGVEDEDDVGPYVAAIFALHQDLGIDPREAWIERIMSDSTRPAP